MFIDLPTCRINSPKNFVLISGGDTSPLPFARGIGHYDDLSTFSSIVSDWRSTGVKSDLRGSVTKYLAGGSQTSKNVHLKKALHVLKSSEIFRKQLF